MMYVGRAWRWVRRVVVANSAALGYTPAGPHGFDASLQLCPAHVVEHAVDAIGSEPCQGLCGSLVPVVKCRIETVTAYHVSDLRRSARAADHVGAQRPAHLTRRAAHRPRSRRN